MHLRSLERLTVLANKLGAEGAMVLGASLQHLTALQALTLSYNKLRAGGGRALGGSLHHVTAHERLVLSDKLWRHPSGSVQPFESSISRATSLGTRRAGL